MTTETTSPTPTLPQITWEELESHNTQTDFWCAYEDKVYDVTKWSEFHPGGFGPIECCAGKDVTNLFDSYHKLQSYRIFGTPSVPCVGVVATSKFETYPKDTGFHNALRKRAADYFKTNNITNVRSMSWLELFNAIFIISGIFTTLIISCYTTLPILVRIAAALMGGFFFFLSLTHVWHQVSHQCFSSRKVIWKIFEYLGGVITGQDMYIWQHRHVFGHHIYTNIAGVDPDIGIYKCSPEEPVVPYRTEYLILPSWIQYWMYVFSTQQMQIDDYLSFFRGSMENVKINNTGFGKAFGLLSAKFIFYFYRIILPMILGFGIWETLVMYAAFMGVSGIMFGYFSQITHISDDRAWPKGASAGWAELQVLTACDYAQDSYFWTYLAGHLNYQVTHHLFPSVAPHHLAALLPIVVDTCKEYNIEYTEYKTFWEACWRHFHHLEQFQVERAGDSILSVFGRVVGIHGGEKSVPLKPAEKSALSNMETAESA